MNLESEYNGIDSHGSFWLAWRIKREKSWHTYWKYPGDVGVAPMVEWSLPFGLVAEDLVFPPPKKVSMGKVRAYGHTGETLFLCRFRAQNPLPIGKKISISGNFSWLTCSVTCLPGNAEMSIDLSVLQNPVPDPFCKPRFDSFRRERPIACPNFWEAQAIEEPSRFLLKIPFHLFDSPSGIYFFNEGKNILSNVPQPVSRYKGFWEISLKKSPWGKPQRYLKGLLYKAGGWDSSAKSFYKLNLRLRAE